MTEVPAEVVDELKKSAPWIATMAVFAFLIGVVSLGTFVFTLVRSHDQPAGQVALLSLTYGPWVILCSLLGLVLARYVRSIAFLSRTQSQDALNRALRQNTQVWRAGGIATIAIVVLSLVFGTIF